MVRNINVTDSSLVENGTKIQQNVRRQNYYATQKPRSFKTAKKQNSKEFNAIKN